MAKELEIAMEKLFHIGDIFTVITGRLMSPRQMDGLREILNFMTGDRVFTQQIERALKECKYSLLEQYPQLNNLDTSGLTSEKWQDWLNQQIEIFGEYLTVRPLPEGQHEFRDPLKEAVEVAGDTDKVIAFVID